MPKKKIIEKKQAIKRITQEQYDERWYYNPNKINERTGNNYFPSVTYINDYLPYISKYHLVEWIAKTGWEESKRFMEHRGEIGSFVHNTIDDMIKIKSIFSPANIPLKFKLIAKDETFIKRALTGFMNFCNDYGARILQTDTIVFGDDYAGTIDLKCSFASDDFKETTIIDIKTSKSVYESHMIQTEAYRRTTGCNNSAVLVLGNDTKKMYTYTEIKKRHKNSSTSQFVDYRQYLYDVFCNAKNSLYTKLSLNNEFEPTKEYFPEKYFIKEDYICLENMM